MRLEVSKRTDLAFRALAHLDSQGQSRGSEIAESVGTTINFLPQLLKPLVVAGWVSSTPGPGGGYRLSCDLSRLTVLQVIEVMEGETDQTRCVLSDAPCPAPEPCAMHDSWMRARGALLAELDATPVATAMASAPTKGE